jgi:hypothetical protein
MKVIGGFSAPPNGFRSGHPSKTSSRQMQETPRCSLSGTHINTDVENAFSDVDFQQAIDLRTRHQAWGTPEAGAGSMTDAGKFGGNIRCGFTGLGFHAGFFVPSGFAK